VCPDDVDELFAALGRVSVRRLFGGAGLYAGDTMFGLLHQGVIYLKADGENAAAFDRENLAPFSYAARGARREIASYRRIPDRLYDDPDELAAWARDALAAAQRGNARKPSAPRGRRKG
jgi:DNA transformation protein